MELRGNPDVPDTPVGQRNRYSQPLVATPIEGPSQAFPILEKKKKGKKCKRTFMCVCWGGGGATLAFSDLDSTPTLKELE